MGAFYPSFEQFGTWETKCRVAASPRTTLRDQKVTEKQTGQLWLTETEGRGGGGKGVTEGPDASVLTMCQRR